jgi:hypothetical protein
MAFNINDKDWSTKEVGWKEVQSDGNFEDERQGNTS